jgi:hypothetical protein
MSLITCEERITVHSSDSDTYAIVFTPILEGRTIASVDSIAVSPSGPTLSNEAANTVAFAHSKTNRTVAIGHAAVFDFTGGSDGTDYTVAVTVTLSDGSTKVRKAVFEVRDS